MSIGGLQRGGARLAGLLAMAPAVALLLAGCGGGASAQSTYTPSLTVAPTAPAPEDTARVTTPATPVGTPTPLPSATADAARPADQCADDDLDIGVQHLDSGAGSTADLVSFTNTGTAPCVLRGYPAVAAAGDGGATRVGAAAKHTDGDVITVRLAPGRSTGALLTSLDLGAEGGALDAACTVAEADGYRVRAPHSDRSVFVAATRLAACTNGLAWMHVGPVGAGTG